MPTVCTYYISLAQAKLQRFELGTENEAIFQNCIGFFFCCLLLFWYSGPASHVLLGDLNYGSEADDAQPRQYRIVERIKHDDFKFPSKYNDIALVKIDGPVQFNNYVRPACLPQSRRIETKHVIASGWGRLSHASNVSEHLLKVVLEIFTPAECNQSYSNEVRQLRRGIDDEIQLCAGSHSDARDTCQVSCRIKIDQWFDYFLCQSTICCRVFIFFLPSLDTILLWMVFLDYVLFVYTENHNGMKDKIYTKSKPLFIIIMCVCVRVLFSCRAIQVVLCKHTMVVYHACTPWLVSHRSAKFVDQKVYRVSEMGENKWQKLGTATYFYFSFSGVYTRVYSYLDWIENIVWPSAQRI